MKISIETKELNTALKKLGKVIGNVSALPVLQNIKMTVNDDDSIVLLASNSETTVEHTIRENIKIKEKGSVLLKHKEFSSIVKNIDSDEIKISQNENSSVIEINGTKAHFKLNSVDVRDYPHIEMNPDSEPIEINGDTLADMIEKSEFAASDNYSTPNLTGINLSGANDRLHFIATDRYRVVSEFKNISLENLKNRTFNITIPVNSLKAAEEFIKGAENVQLYPQDNLFFIKTPESTIRSQLIAEGYPNIQRILKEPECPISLTVKVPELLETIKRALILSEEEAVITLSFSRNDIIISSEAALGSLQESILDITAKERYDIDETEISLSAKYLSEALKTSDNAEIRIRFSSAVNPIYIYDGNEEKGIDRTQVILPVRKGR